MSQITSLTDPDAVDALGIRTTTNDGVVRVVLSGEADVGTLRDLEVALDHVRLEGATAVHLELGELDFADVATIRRLVEFARTARGSGLDLTTCGASRVLHEVTGLLAVRDDLGLT